MGKNVKCFSLITKVLLDIMTGHSRGRGNPQEVVEGVSQAWIPACAGMTVDIFG